MGHKNKLPDVFNTEQLVKLFDAIDQPKVAIAVAVTFYCGLRISEICNLKIEHVDLTARKIKIVDAKNSRRFATGYGNDRYVPLPPHMISPIKKWLEIIQGGVWFLPSDKSPDTHIRKKSLHEQFRQVLKKAALLLPLYEIDFAQRNHGIMVSKHKTIHKYHYHTLRHAYATYLCEKGVDNYTISHLLGHKDVTTTQIYARMSDQQKTKAVELAFDTPLRSQVLPAQTRTMEDRMLEIKRLELEVKKMELMRSGGLAFSP